MRPHPCACSNHAPGPAVEVFSIEVSGLELQATNGMPLLCLQLLDGSLQSAPAVFRLPIPIDRPTPCLHGFSAKLNMAIVGNGSGSGCTLVGANPMGQALSKHLE